MRYRWVKNCCVLFVSFALQLFSLVGIVSRRSALVRRKCSGGGGGSLTNDSGDLRGLSLILPSDIGQVAKISFSNGPAMIRDEDGQLTGYVYIDLNMNDYGGFVKEASNLLRQKLKLPAGYTYTWSGEYEFELRAKERLKIILPVVFFVIFVLLYMIFKSATEAMVLILPTFYAMTGGLILQWLLGYNSSVAVWVGYIALFRYCS
jgi:Cu/Ag efflux pump CusA